MYFIKEKRIVDWFIHHKIKVLKAVQGYYIVGVVHQVYVAAAVQCFYVAPSVPGFYQYRVTVQ